MRSFRKSVFVVLIFGLVLSVIIAAQFQTSKHDRNAEFFNRIAREHFMYVSKSIEWHVNSLSSVADYFLASDWVSPEEFKTFTQTLMANDPGYDAIGWIANIDAQDINQLRIQLASEGMHLPENLTLPSYYLTRLATDEAYSPMLGKNVDVDPELDEFVSDAARSGKTMFFPHEPDIFLNKKEAELEIQKQDKHDHLFIVSPVIKRNGEVMGFAVSKMDLVAIARYKIDPGYNPMMSMTISSVDEDGHKSILYNSLHKGIEGSTYHYSHQMNLNGLVLNFDFWPTPYFLQTYRNYQGFLVFVMLILMTFSGAFYIDRMHGSMLALEEANHRAAESSRLKNEFMATMSHEIRSPMTGVLGMAELLLEGKLADEQRAYARTIVNSAESLLTIINDILDFSRIEANRLDLEPVPLNLLELVDDVVGLHSIKAREKALEVAVRYVPGTEQFVYGDPARIRQVLGNLINNAIKFTEKGNVIVTVREERRQMSTGPGPGNDNINFVFTVEDTGIGIPIESQAKIFDKFYQLDGSMRRDVGGMGLGLAICKRLVNIMNGMLSVQSIPDHGSVFTFNLVLRRNREESYSPIKPAVLHDVRALVVDDLPVICTVVSEQLNLAGMRCAGAGSGAEALEMMHTAAAAGDPYKIVVIDYQMPEMDGEALARSINDSATLSDTCLVMISGTGIPVMEDDFMRKGFSAHLSKPVKGRFLIEAIALIWRKFKEGENKTFIRIDTQFMQRPDHSESPDLKGARILVAEDNRINQAFTEDTLVSMGCEITIVPNGQEAVRAVEAKEFDLVLMDCQMPVMDGFEATRQICALKAAGKVPMDLKIVALTANSMKGDRERCQEAGMDDYLSKPVRSRELKERVHYWVSRTRKHQQRIVHPPVVTEAPVNNVVQLHPVDPSDDLLSVAAVAEAKRILKVRYDSFLSVYIEDTNAYIEAVKTALNGDDIEAAIRPAHTIKSSSRQMGAVRLGAEAETLEKTIRQVVEGGDATSKAALQDRLSNVENVFALTRDALLRQAG